MLDTIERDGFKAVIEHDDDAANPRTEWDNLSKMVCFHKRYKLGDKHDYKQSDHQSWGELYRAILVDEEPPLVAALYLYDHSGLRISVEPFGCKWDSGQVGWAYVPGGSPEFAGMGDPEARRTRALEIIKSEVEVYDQYLSGEVFGVRVLNPDGEEVDSCWGFYGYDHAVEEANQMLDGALGRTHEILPGLRAA
jgi:hypothetical protein